MRCAGDRRQPLIADAWLARSAPLLRLSHLIRSAGSDVTACLLPLPLSPPLLCPGSKAGGLGPRPAPPPPLPPPRRARHRAPGRAPRRPPPTRRRPLRPGSPPAFGQPVNSTCRFRLASRPTARPRPPPSTKPLAPPGAVGDKPPLAAGQRGQRIEETRPRGTESPSPPRGRRACPRTPVACSQPPPPAPRPARTEAGFRLLVGTRCPSQKPPVPRERAAAQGQRAGGEPRGE